MSTFNDYWAALVKATPELADDNTYMKIRVLAFKRQIEKAYWHGHGNAEAQQQEKKKSDPFGIF